MRVPAKLAANRRVSASLRSPFSKWRAVSVLTAAVVGVVGSSDNRALAVVVTHTYNATSGNWSTNASWTNGAPATNIGDIAQYNTVSTAGSVGLDVSNVTIGQLENVNTGGWTINNSGSNIFTLDNTGGSTNFLGDSNAFIGTTSTGTLSVAPGVVVANTSLDIAANSGAVTISGGVSGTGNVVLQNNSSATSGVNFTGGSTAVPTDINNSGTVTNSGSGMGSVTIGGANASGTLAIGSNVTQIIENSTTSTLIIGNLQLGSVAVNSNGTTFTNNNASGSSLLDVIDGITGSGNVTLNNNSSISGGITINVSSGANVTASVNNAGTVTNSGSGMGSVIITSGSVGKNAIGANVTQVIENSGSSNLNIGTASGLGSIAMNSGGTTLTNNNSSGSSILSVTSSVTGSGALTLMNNSAISGGITLSPGSGSVSVNCTGAIANTGTGNGSTIISAPVGSAVTSITENSATSPLTLSGNSTAYKNATNLTVGTLIIGSATALGGNGTSSGTGGALNIAGGTTLDATGSPTITTTNAENWNGDFTFAGTSSLNTGPGAVTLLNATRTVTVTTNTLTIGGVISGSAGIGLTKAGAGTLALNNSNTYSGATTISAGTLKLGSGGSINSSSLISIAGNAVYDVSSLSGYSLAQNLAAKGTGTANVAGPTSNPVVAGSFSLDMQDATNIGTLAFTHGLSLSGSTLKFDLGTTLGSNDEITTGGAVSGTGATINVDALSTATSLTGGDYTLLSATGGGLSGLTFGLSSSTLTVNGVAYSLSLSHSTNTAEIISVTPPGGSSAWIASGSGNWEAPANWNANTIPMAAGQTATFADSIGSGSAIVTLTANETVGTVAFTGTMAGSYTIAASSTKALTLDNLASASAITVNTGNQTITAPVTLTTHGVNITTAASSSLTLGGTVSGTGGIDVTAGSAVKVATTGSVAVPLTVDGTVTFATNGASGGILTQTVPSITIHNGGVVNVTDPGSGNHANRTILTTNSLNFSGSSGGWQGKMDLAGNDMIIVAGGSSATVLTNTTNQLAQGFNGTTPWTGTAGIVSSTAASDGTSLSTLGVATGLTTFDGSVVPSTDVLVKYTYYGDANLNGHVDGTDYTMIDTGFGGGGTGWQYGDFNYDGHIDGSDYSLIDNTFNQQSSAGFAAAVATNTAEIAAPSGSTAVPEPASLGLLGISAIGLTARRRRTAK
jgi:Passenger-associated-transport-repeat/PEP-CTERM motif